MGEPREIRNCRCGAPPGGNHIFGCDLDRCRKCGGQAISCGCIYETVLGVTGDELEDQYPDVYRNGPTPQMYAQWDAMFPRRVPWSGEYPGAVECREYGFWCYWGPVTDDSPYGGPWVRCGADHPDATEDLTRLITSCHWDREKQKWVLRRDSR